jgi:hypothetical protein
MIILLIKEYLYSIFFTGKLVFEREKGYQRILHNETWYAIQRRLHFGAMNRMVLPIRVFATRNAQRFHPVSVSLLISCYRELSILSFC